MGGWQSGDDILDRYYDLVLTWATSMTGSNAAGTAQRSSGRARSRPTRRCSAARRSAVTAAA